MEDHQHQPQPIVEKEETEANIVSPANVDDYFESFPPGYRFNPYDGELIVHYLKKKINEETLPPNRIHDVNLYKFNPETLSERYMKHGEKEWYFFTPRDRKYRNGKRPNRAAADGYWKATGTDKTVKFKGVNVGLRTALVFYKGRTPKGEKTNWIMHEFRVLNSPPKPPTTVGNEMRLDDCVLCKIYKNVDRSRIIRNRHPDVDEEVPSPALQNYNEHLPPENSAILAYEASVIPNEAMEMDNGCYNTNVDPNPMAFSQPSDFTTFHYGFDEFDMGYFDQWEWLTQ